MSKRTSYSKIYRLDVRPRPRLSHGHGFTYGQVFTVRGCVSASMRARVHVDPCLRERGADARGHASRGQWSAQTRLSVRGDAGLGGAESRVACIKRGALPLFPHFQPIPVE
jgi:hypothetical protein